MGEDDTENELILSTNTLSALQEFYAERDQREKQFEDLKSATKRLDQDPVPSMDMFVEDWNASQFWYSDDTATILAKQLLEGATSANSIAVVSVPSVFVRIKNLIASGPFIDPPRVFLFEFDKRFSLFSEYIYYDFRNPLDLPCEYTREETYMYAYELGSGVKRPKVRVQSTQPSASPDIFRLLAHSCHDCAVAFHHGTADQHGSKASSNRLHWGKDGESHNEDIFWGSNNKLRTAACSREAEQRVPLLRQF